MRKIIALCMIFCSFFVNASVLASNVFSINQYVSSCDLHANMADSYILALSSEPGFCETYGYEAGKSECLNLSQNSYESYHFTLHGLWPNQTACGQHYGYCTSSTSKTNHCDYEPIPLSSETSSMLKRMMPSYRYGSCLERHEWNKHGSCQVLSSDEYFALATRLAIKFDESPFADYVRAHRGQKVELSELHEQIALSFGSENLGKVHLGCSKGILVDIYISLPLSILFEEPLHSLMTKALDYPIHDTCPKRLIISKFSKEEKVAWK